MRQLYTRQQTFEGGIVENWKQDDFRQPNSVLYLENYNPNLEHKSLIKRMGEKVIEYLNIPIAFYSSLFTTNVFDYPNNREVVLSNEIMLTSNPDYNKTFITFLKRLPNDISVLNRDGLTDLELLALEPECTGIVARVIENDGVEDVLDWHEPFINEAEYPGWYTVGLYTDHKRYGEKLYFTTLLKNKVYGTDLDNYLFPVYEWGLWDLTKKRKDGKVWWNGIDFNNIDTDTKTYRKWKVKTPTMDLIRENIVGYAYWDKNAGEWKREGNEKPIEVLFMENDLDISPVRISGDKSTFNPLYGIPGEDGQYKGVSKERYSYLSRNADDEFPKLTPDTYYGNDTQNIFYESYSIFDLKDYIDKIKTTEFWDVVNTSFNELEYVKYDTPSITDGFITHGKPITGKFKIAFALFDPYGFGYDDIGRRIYYTRSPGVALDNYGYPLGFSFRNLYLRYIDNNVPRPWHKEEKIPFVLTAKIGGVETILYQDIYTIKTPVNYIVPKSYVIVEGSNVFQGSYTDTVKDGFTSTIKHDSGISLAVSSNNTYYSSPHISLEEVNGDSTEIKLSIKNMLQFTIRIKKSYLSKLLEQDVTEFNLYVAEKHETESYLKTIGIVAPVEPPPGYYMKPALDSVDTDDVDFDYSKFRLVKSFLIEGASQEIDYSNYSGFATKTNAWLTGSDDGDTNSEDYLYAVPKEIDDDGPIPSNNIPFLNNTYQEQGYPYGGGKENNRIWYPDFTLYDYPDEAPPLTLNNSGEYWKGLGARHIEIIQGRTFIAGCIDEDGKEEQSVVRYSAVQNGIASKDIFVKEDQVTFGHNPITALLNYRDQLWIFNEYSQYRMIPHNVFDVSSWEVLDVQDAQGCLSNKTLCIAPNGVCFASRNGIWISDGRIPTSLTNNPKANLTIQSLYQKLAIGKPYEYQQQADPGRPFIDINTGFNPYLELYYDKDNDELVLSTPVRKNDDEMFESIPENYIIDDWEYFTHEVRLIYNFSNNNWRMESYDGNMLSNVAVANEKVKTYSSRGKFHLSENKFACVREMYRVPDENQIGRNSDYSESYVTFNEPSRELDHDVYYFFGVDNIREIVGKIITHEIGDGENDYVLRRAYLECSPKDKSDLTKGIYGYKEFLYEGFTPTYVSDVSPTINEDIDNGYTIGETWKNSSTNHYFILLSNSSGNANWQFIVPAKDPYLFYELRSRSWNDQVDKFDFNDIVSINMQAKKGNNPFLSLMQTPGNTNHGPSDKVVAHESLVMLYPRNTKFRRSRFRLISKIIVKIKTLTNEYAMFKRRSR